MAFGDKFPTYSFKDVQGQVDALTWSTLKPEEVLANCVEAGNGFFPFEAEPLTTSVAVIEHKTTTIVDFVPMPVDIKIKVTPPAQPIFDIPLPPTKMHTMPCFYCSKPVVPGLELPVVLEWGTRTSDMPAFVGTPYKTVAHQNCNAEARKRK